MNTLTINSTRHKMRDSQMEHLKKGKIRPVGPIESFLVRRQGKNDGSKGLPKQMQSGMWCSPWMKKDEAAYEESCSKAWGYVQLILTEEYALIGRLLDQAERIEGEVAELLAQKPEEPSASEQTYRMKGEEDLSEDQVRRRRNREFVRRTARYNARVTELKAQITETRKRLEEVLNYVLEVCKGTRMCCERVRNHVIQRRNLYWESAYANHARKADMPAFPEPIPQTSLSETKYMAQHKVMEEDAVAAIDRMRDLAKHFGETLAETGKKETGGKESGR